MKEKFLENAKREYPAWMRFLVLLIAAPFFVLIFPGALVAAGVWLDKKLDWIGFASGAVMGIGWGIALLGLLFAFWAVYLQFRVGRGTPVPAMATQTLITQPPYTWTRNPMALGTLTLYFGVAMAAGSPSAILFVFLVSAVLLLYIKFVEEKEMELRFGDDYRAYRDSTPFFFPRLRKR
jgi:protein-S-isoprenylcysteine O-methyltransferase Ste14